MCYDRGVGAPYSLERGDERSNFQVKGRSALRLEGYSTWTGRHRIGGAMFY
jgi:hypothetical protein